MRQKDLVSDQDCDQVSDQDKSQDILHAVLDFCITEKSKQEICSFIGYRNLTYFTRRYLNPLLASGQLKMTIPDKPNSRKQNILLFIPNKQEAGHWVSSPIVLLLFIMLLLGCCLPLFLFDLSQHLSTVFFYHSRNKSCALLHLFSESTTT